MIDNILPGSATPASVIMLIPPLFVRSRHGTLFAQVLADALLGLPDPAEIRHHPVQACCNEGNAGIAKRLDHEQEGTFIGGLIGSKEKIDRDKDQYCGNPE
jgi:hypothetical protein